MRLVRISTVRVFAFVLPSLASYKTVAVGRLEATPSPLIDEFIVVCQKLDLLTR